MKKLILPALFAIAMQIGAQTTQFYVVPVNPDGTINTSGGDYPDKIALDAQGNGNFSADGVTLGNGFYFCGITGSGSSLYTIPSWGVNNPVYGYPNPLAICSPNDPCIKTEPGSYDIELINRNNTSTGYHMFTISPVGQTEIPYPEKLFLVWGADAGQYLEITGKNGIYTASLDTSAPFVISYEPNFKDNVYFFGPVSDQNETLEKDIKTPIDYNGGTDYGFVFDPEANPDSQVVIDLTGTQPYITVEKKTHTAIDAVDPGSDTETPTAIYTIGGIAVGENPGALPKGIYIVKAGNTAGKLLIR